MLEISIPPKSRIQVDASQETFRLTFMPPFSWRGTVIDFETTGLPPQPWEIGQPWPEIVTLGIAYGRRIYVYQRAAAGRERFREFCRSTICRTPRPWYAYSCQFEEKMGGFSGRWKDLMVYGEGYSEWRDESYSYRMRCSDAASHKGLTMAERQMQKGESYEEYLGRADQYRDIDGSSVPEAWRLWLERKDASFLSEIAYHSLLDLLRETYLTMVLQSERENGRRGLLGQAAA